MLRMILDTDTYNEVDDQFALVYALMSKEAVKVEAVHAAPFYNENSNGPEDGMEKSYGEIIRLMNLMGEETDKIVFKGARQYMGSKDTPCECEAIDNLIRLAGTADENDPIYVVAIGAPTNVSSAIVKEPSIKKHIKVIWLGGNSRHWPTGREFNQMQDIAASRVLFDSGVDLVQIPVHNVASHLKVGVPELKACMGKSEIAEALTNLVDEALDKNPARTRIIWDISAVAKVVIPGSVRTVKIHSPVLHDDENCSYSLDERRHLIECAYYLNRDWIFMDFYKKINKLK